MRMRLLLLAAALTALACAPSSAPAPAAPAAKPAAATAPAAAAKPAAASAAATAAPAAAAAPAAPAAAPARQTVRYGYVPIIAAAAMYLANDRGYFAEQGIELEMVSFDSGALLIPAVSAGQLEAGHGVPGPALFNALAREVTMKTVSVISYNGTVLMLRKELADSGQIRSVQDLKGRRISFMVEGSPIDFTMRRVLQQNGLSLQDVELQRLSMPDSAPALANNAVDAAAVVEPFPVLIENRGIGVRALAVQDQVWKDAASIMLVGPSMLNRGDVANTALLVGFVKGLRDMEAAMRDMQLVDPDAISIVSRWTNIPPDVIGRARTSGWPPNGRLDLDDLQRQQEFWVREGDVRTPANLSNFVEYKYLDAAVAQLR